MRAQIWSGIAAVGLAAALSCAGPCVAQNKITKYDRVQRLVEAVAEKEPRWNLGSRLPNDWFVYWVVPHELMATEEVRVIIVECESDYAAFRQFRLLPRALVRVGIPQPLRLFGDEASILVDYNGRPVGTVWIRKERTLVIVYAPDAAIAKRFAGYVMDQFD